MSNDEFNFQKELKKRIFDADPNLDRHEILTAVFKYQVSALFEWILTNKGEVRIELDAMVQIKRNVINEFRQTELGEYQKSVEQYEDLFEIAIQEIFELAGARHKGEQSVKVEQTLAIDPKKYVNEGGLFIPDYLKN